VFATWPSGPSCPAHVAEQFKAWDHPDPSGVILLKVLEYLAYKVQYADFSTEDITEDFSDRIDPYIALELYVSLQHMSSANGRLTAADFLEA